MMNRKRHGIIALLFLAGVMAWSNAEASVVADGAKVEKLAGGFAFTEGPAADAQGNIYFSDIPNNRIHKWSLDGELSTFRENSGGANGLYFDKDGNLLACEGGGRRLVSIDKKGEVTVMADKYRGKKFNSLNDLWIDPKGGVYFTDPRYGNREGMEQDGEHVYYISPDREKLTRVIDDMVRPNGLIGTPDGKTLYVTDNGDGKTFVYSINPDGTLTGKNLFAPQGSDGMTIDNEGNVYLTSRVVAVYNKNGEKIEEIKIPEGPANVTFGGKNNQTLFITARTSLYSIRMRVKAAEDKRKSSYEKITIVSVPATIETPSLMGRTLPELKAVGVELPDGASGKRILVCFWDMNQRPSRQCVMQLADRAEELAEKGIVVACVQAADIDDGSLNKWLKENKIPFPIGKAKAEMGKSNFEWGIRMLPWLILTNQSHLVTAEGFGPGQLDDKIGHVGAEMKFEQDIIKTSAGDLKIVFIGHGTLMFDFDGKIIHVDPVGRATDYAGMPKADIILLTHEHGDHLDTKVIDVLRKDATQLVLTKACSESVTGLVMSNGDVKTIRGIKIEAVPAYNIVHMRSAGNPFHPKGRGNGYVITFGDKRIYIAGDTENTAEMKRLENIDVAFLPMNLPYTMTPEMVADAARAFKPKILYPYHYGQTDPNKLVELLKDSGGIDVRIRKMR